ncbi:MAG TPA: hypothetical protein VNB90_15130 [Cytophagaceae bacterium]|jgi:uncharacterized protein YggU (UPF0235/DUF167 family)|nr:hypothetical protein [Cytophagaceae bacterium]
MLKNKKTRLEKIDEQIQLYEKRLKKCPQDKAAEEALIELRAEQLYVLKKNIKILSEYIQNEKENDYYLEEGEI